MIGVFLFLVCVCGIQRLIGTCKFLVALRLGGAAGLDETMQPHAPE